jgi:hypothetical protein
MNPNMQGFWGDLGGAIVGGTKRIITGTKNLVTQPLGGYEASEEEPTIIDKLAERDIQKAREKLIASKDKSPNIFQIKYTKGGSDKEYHTSLNRIKTCALTSMSVNYTPDNSYMTFTDTERTMTSYDMALTFQELEPVYDRDYQQFADKSTIGF